MSYIHDFFDFIFHIDTGLDKMVNEYGTLIYAVLFVIIFIETGLIIMPFLPGDSMLFAAGAICARQAGEPNAPLNIIALITLLSFAAILGDNCNYAVGRFLGERAVKIKLFGRNLVKQANIDKTHVFFEVYGTKAIILARFAPFLRTFTPFVAGVAKMSYRRKFLPFDIVGGVLWICVSLLSGFFLGKNHWVKEHFSSVIVAISFISLLPMIVGYLKHKFSKKKV